jgi:O-antigen/teichoic acid export membrane protein
LCLPLIFFGKTLLTLWMGRNFAEQTHGLLTVLAIAFGLLSINVVPHLTLLALGQARFVSLLNIVGCAISLAVGALLIPSLGPMGAALGRLFFGPIVTLNYVRAAKSL